MISTQSPQNASRPNRVYSILIVRQHIHNTFSNTQKSSNIPTIRRDLSFSKKGSQQLVDAESLYQIFLAQNLITASQILIPEQTMALNRMNVTSALDRLARRQTSEFSAFSLLSVTIALRILHSIGDFHEPNLLPLFISAMQTWIWRWYWSDKSWLSEIPGCLPCLGKRLFDHVQAEHPEILMFISKGYSDALENVMESYTDKNKELLRECMRREHVRKQKLWKRRAKAAK